jgi:rfaE bifunctional protein kinase chain/domain
MGAKVRICSVTGADENGQELMDLLADAGADIAGIIRLQNRVTTTKTRILGNQHQMLRIDEENTHFLSASEEAAVKTALSIALNESDGLLFQDYDKGVLTSGIISYGTFTAGQKGIPVTVDPKFRSFGLFQNVTLFKPNLKELRAGLQLPDLGKNTDELIEADQLLREKLNHQYTLITLSEKGMFGRGPEGHFLTPAHVRNIADVSGAGDTVIAVATLCLAAGSDFRTAVELANLAGGLVCESPGVVPVNREHLLEEALQKLCGK